MEYEERIKLSIDNLYDVIKQLKGELTAKDAVNVEGTLTEVGEELLGGAFDEKFPDRYEED